MSTMTQVAVAHRSLDLCVEIIQITSIEFVAMKAYEGVANSKAWPTAMVMVLQFCVQAEPVRTKGELRATSFYSRCPCGWTAALCNMLSLHRCF